LIAQFLALFHPYGYINKPLSGGSWFSANEKWKLPDSEILKAIAGVHPRFFIGCRAGKTTRFAVFDIDQKSKYHNLQFLQNLLRVLAEAGLSRSCLYQSSHSGGWHLYLFFDEPINCADLRKQLVKLLILNDFQLSKGQLELFPHPGAEGSLGLGLRLPLQAGWAWLCKQTLDVDCYREELSPSKALDWFMRDLADANPYEAFRNLKSYVQELEQRKAAATAHGVGAVTSNVVPLRKAPETAQSGEFSDFVRAVFHKLPPGIIVDNWYKGRLYHLNGLTAPSQRAEAIECLGHYLFYGDPSRDLPPLGYGYEQERQWALEEFLQARNNGQSKDINRGRADAFAQVERAANWRPAHKKNVEPQKYAPALPISWIRENANRKTNARKRIADALDCVKKRQRSFTTVELQEAAGCSRRTLYTHADIWRKDYEDLAEGFFANCTDEYNDVVGAGSTQTQPPTTSLEQDMPPGRLAARRIACEISMRAERDSRSTHKEALRSQEASEKEWMDNVTRLTKNEPSSLSIFDLKALLIVLISYLSMAPNEEGQMFIQQHIDQLRSELSKATSKPLFVVRPP